MYFPRESNLLMFFFFGSNESIFRFSNPVNVARSLLEGNRDHLLTQARSELMKQDTKWNLLTIVLMSVSNKLMPNDWIWRAPVKSQREQVRLQEE